MSGGVPALPGGDGLGATADDLPDVLIAPATAPSAEGARVTLSADGRRQASWKLGGGSDLFSSDPRIHFGLGAAERVDSLEVRQPSGRVDLLQEGDPTPRLLAVEVAGLPIERFPLIRSRQPDHSPPPLHPLLLSFSPSSASLRLCVRSESAQPGSRSPTSPEARFRSAAQVLR